MRDTWRPYGTGDMLERAAIIGWRLDARTDALLDVLFDMVSAAGARALGEEAPAIAVGARADLFFSRGGDGGGGDWAASAAGGEWCLGGGWWRRVFTNRRQNANLFMS